MTRYLFTLFLSFTLFSAVVHCQNGTAAGNVTSPVVDAPVDVGGNSTLGDPVPVACKPGVSVGYMLIRQPNSTSLLTVGNTYNVSWDWSVSVTQPPSYVDMYIQLIAPGVTVTWKRLLLGKQRVSPRWFMFTLDGLVDGKYKIRLVPDGKETYGVRSDQQPCFGNGEAIPSVSGVFTISNPRGDLGNYPNPFPANFGNRTVVDILGTFIFCLLSRIMYNLSFF